MNRKRKASIDSYFTTGQKRTQDTENVPGIKNIINSTAIDESNNEIFFIEIACFEKVVKNMLKRLPKDKFMENTLKMRRCLRRAILMSSTESLKNVTSCIDVYYSPSASLQVHFEKALLHVKHVTHVLAQAMFYCEQSYGFLLQKLRIGHILDSLVMSVGLLSRIYVLSKITVIRMCYLYQEIMNLINNEHKGASSAENCSQLPRNLSDWLEKETDVCLITNESLEAKTKPDVLDQLHETGSSTSNVPWPNKNDLTVDQMAFENSKDFEDIGELVPRFSNAMREPAMAKPRSNKNARRVLKERLKFFGCNPSEMKELKTDLARIRTLKGLRNLYKKLHSQASKYVHMLGRPLSVHQLTKVRKIIKTSSKKIQRLKPERNISRLSVINEATAEIFLSLQQNELY